jgi:dUTP pyrophosphatase
MKVVIKRVDPSLPVPKYETAGACCFDLLMREKITIPAHNVALLPTNIIMEVPEGYVLFITPRSSTPKKKGLLIPHGIGIIDQDFCGPKDEILFQVLNYTDTEVVVEKGERLAQGCLLPVAKALFVESETISSKTRGGIGSTG